jgi:glycosyltransferase involved in cell wall biosynthesis
MIEKSDITVCNSSYLASYAKQYNNLSYDIGQGCEVESFFPTANSTHSVLDDLNGIVVGYCGALLSSRLDIELIATIANQNEDIQFVLVGPEDETFKKSILHQIKNIHFTGSKPFSELPSYVHRFDVCINPQLVNEMTLGNYPRKIDEYLAAGKPVVATETPAMESFRPYTYLSANAKEFTDNLKEAISEASNDQLKEKRIRFAASHTWEASVGKVYEVINELSLNNKLKKEVYI